MNIKSKILIVVAIMIIAIIVIVRYLFNEKYESFKDSIDSYEISQFDLFILEKEKKIDFLKNTDTALLRLFTEQFDTSVASYESDTNYVFLYLNKKVKYISYSNTYINCLAKKCAVDKINREVENQITIKEAAFGRGFGSTFVKWYPKLKKGTLIQRKKVNSMCEVFFLDLFVISISENFWDELSKFLKYYDKDIQHIKNQNNKIIKQFESRKSSTLSKLKWNTKEYFKENLNNKKHIILKTESTTRSYNSLLFGVIDYTVNMTTFYEEAFQTVAQDAFNEQWRSNFLSTGSMPYSSCYGSSNYCSGWGCSEIYVFNGGSDVIVMIKNSNGRVIRHAYIRALGSFTFNVPNDTYSVYFYSGVGWNPYKPNPESPCKVKGGFVSKESTGKDTYVRLEDHKLSYRLTLVTNGNFSMKASSKNEMF